jgi:hypothetical protein
MIVVNYPPASNINITVAQLLDHAIRICGKSTSELTPEMIRFSKENLLLSLMELNNRGIPIWALEDRVLGFEPLKWKYFLPPDVIDIFDLNWRTMNHAIVSPSGGPTAVDTQYLTDYEWFSYATTSDYFLLTGNTVEIYDYFGLFFYGEQTVTLTFSASTDGINYVPITTYPTTTYTDGFSIWYDFMTPFQGSYLKVSVAPGETLSSRGFYTGYTGLGREIPIAKMNRDDFFAYPSKGIQGTPINYYFKKTVPPEIWFWQSPNSAQVFNWSIHYYTYDTIDQFVSMPNAIKVPVWFIDCIKFTLATKMSWELPGVDPELRNGIAAQADRLVNIAEFNNSDDSNINLLGAVLVPYQN